MTDAEVLKAWEWCEHFENNIVLKGKGDEKCGQALQVMGIVRNVLKDYGRQKAEIERLKKDKYIIKDGVLELVPRTDIEEIKSEARKEFVKKFEKKIKDVNFTLGQTWEIQCALKEVLEEMESE